METLRQEAIKVISKLPDTANIDDIMYELYVIDKIKKGKEASERGDMILAEELRIPSLAKRGCGDFIDMPPLPKGVYSRVSYLGIQQSPPLMPYAASKNAFLYVLTHQTINSTSQPP